METPKHSPEATESDLVTFLYELVLLLPHQPQDRDRDEPIIYLTEIIGETSFSYSVLADQETETKWSVVVTYERESSEDLDDYVLFESDRSYYEFTIQTDDELTLETNYSRQLSTEFEDGNLINRRIDTVISTDKLTDLNMMLLSGRFNPIDSRVKREE